jgi:predicted amidohydrolase YtcJ
MPSGVAELILRGGAITTLDRARPTASAVAVADGRFVRVGSDEEVSQLAGADTTVIDLGGAAVLPGLCDSHLHLIRGGLNYNMEVRWDGVRSLAQAMHMLKRQVDATPPPQWVRVVGGFTELQFEERRLPTIDELNALAPDTPVFILHLYDRALLNGAALRAVGYDRTTRRTSGRRDRSRRPRQPDRPAAREAERRDPLRDARPGAPAADRVPAQFDSALHARAEPARRDERDRRGRRLAELSAGLPGHPQLADAGQLTVRVAYNLFTQKPKEEKDDFLAWTAGSRYKQGDDYFRHNGAGEMLVFSAADFEDFRQPRPTCRPRWRASSRR